MSLAGETGEMRNPTRSPPQTSVTAAVTVFALQDGFSRHLASTYNVFMVIMIRYWFFAAFVIALALRKPGGLRATLRTRHPILHSLRPCLDGQLSKDPLFDMSVCKADPLVSVSWQTQ